MPSQPELFSEPLLALKPVQGRDGPRLWVRRLVIWSDPSTKIRDIQLRPGLNVIWSPDGGDAGIEATERVIGHGSGKTLFCRLLRFCLGEQRFADEDQRDRIAHAFPDGAVGAEILIDGVAWAVYRTIGVRRRHLALPNADLDVIATGDGAATGMEPLTRAIEAAILGPEVARMTRLPAAVSAWTVALAWLSRDQECRFGSVVEWRSPASGSEAPLPASGSESGPRRDFLRILLRAITQEEQSLRESETSLKADEVRLQQDASALDWQIRRTYPSLMGKLGLPVDPLPDLPIAVLSMREAAKVHLAKVTGTSTTDRTDLSRARAAREAARKAFEDLEIEARALTDQMAFFEDQVAKARSEIPGLDGALKSASNPVCPVCEVPIDTALAGRCGISVVEHNERECRERLAASRKRLDQQEEILRARMVRQQEIKPSLALARQALDRADAHVAALEAAHDARTDAWRAATRLADHVEHFASLVEDRDQARRGRRAAEEKLKDVREGIGRQRDRQGKVFSGLNQKFEPIIKALLGPDTTGSVTLSGKGFEIRIDAGGDRRTAAIDSLKVVAFDLACLCLSIEEATNAPAFLIHDSPREADLGASIYGEVFKLVRDLESMTPMPMFQYIITTTTPPPEGMRVEPWLRLRLSGSPGSERLMRRDL